MKAEIAFLPHDLVWRPITAEGADRATTAFLGAVRGSCSNSTSRSLVPFAIAQRIGWQDVKTVHTVLRSTIANSTA
jgi:hypothetical protein